MDKHEQEDLYQQYGNFVQIGEKDIFYLKAGSGPPLVLFHGLGHNSIQWLPNIPDFSENFTVYALDFPGFGQSTPAEPYEINTSYIPLFMRDFMEALEIENPSLMGGSFGGLIALHYALRYEDRVSKLILMDSAGLGKEIMWRWRFATIPGLGELFVFFDSLDLSDKDSRLWKTTKLPLVGGLLKRLYTRFVTEHADEVRRQDLASLKLLRHGVSIFGQRRTITRVNKLHLLDVPTLILWGEHDKVFPIEQAYEACRLIPDCRVHPLDAHHWPAVEKEVMEELTEVVTQFILSS